MDFSLLRQVLIGVVCNLLIIDSGFHEGWSTPMIPRLEHEDSVRITVEQGAWIINLMYVGVGLGSAIPLLLMDSIGRKWTMLIAAIPKIASWLIYACAKDHMAFYLGRLLAGIGTGVTYCCIPMYIGEVSTKTTRGPLSASLAVWINIGMLMIYAIGMYTSRLAVSLIAITVPLMFLLSFMWLPKSAVFLAKKNRFDKAERVLKWSLARDNVDKELEEIKRMVADEASDLGFLRSIQESYGRPECRRAFLITAILMGTMMFSGAAPILAYQTYTFDEAGFSVPSELSVLLSGAAIVVSGLVCVIVVKRTGKRPLLLVAGPVTALSLAAVAAFFTLKSSGFDVSSIAWAPTFFIVIYALAYGLALNPLPLSYIGEIFPLDVKVPAALFCSLYYALGSLVVVKIYQVLQVDYGGTHVPFWFFAGLTVFLSFMIYFFVPETEGKTLEEIQMELRGKSESS